MILAILLRSRLEIVEQLQAGLHAVGQHQRVRPPHRPVRLRQSHRLNLVVYRSFPRRMTVAVGCRPRSVTTMHMTTISTAIMVIRMIKISGTDELVMVTTMLTVVNREEVLAAAAALVIGDGPRVVAKEVIVVAAATSITMTSTLRVPLSPRVRILTLRKVIRIQALGALVRSVAVGAQALLPFVLHGNLAGPLTIVLVTRRRSRTGSATTSAGSTES